MFYTAFSYVMLIQIHVVSNVVYKSWVLNYLYKLTYLAEDGAILETAEGTYDIFIFIFIPPSFY